MNITIYSTSTCATCHLVTGWLDKQGITYEKKNTDEDPDAMTEFMSVNDGQIGVPFSVITSDSGKQSKILGFDRAKFEQALGVR